MSAITGMTNYTAEFLKDLDAQDCVECLPTLLETSCRILDFLAPNGLDYDTPTSMANMMRELKVPGSHRAKQLKRFEAKFDLDREVYGTDTKYIQTRLVVQKIFGSSEAAAVRFRPDVILQAANLATMLMTLLVTDKGSSSSINNFGAIDKEFPEQFLSGLGTTREPFPQYGGSELASESFSVGLALRTQYAIVALISQQGSKNFDPLKIVLTCFFEASPPSESNTALDDQFSDGQPKDILRNAPNSPKQMERIKSRVRQLQEAFRDNRDAADAQDLVDFEYLDNQFPWDNFIMNLARWTRSRLEEIIESIEIQGGIESIMKCLIETIMNNNSQANLDDLPHDSLPSMDSTRRLLPSANIVTGASGTR